MKTRLALIYLVTWAVLAGVAAWLTWVSMPGSRFSTGDRCIQFVSGSCNAWIEPNGKTQTRAGGSYPTGAIQGLVAGAIGLEVYRRYRRRRTVMMLMLRRAVRDRREYEPLADPKNCRGCGASFPGVYTSWPECGLGSP